MLQVIDSSYGECSSSIFQARFMNSIQELLIAPMSAYEIVFGYVVGSLARALLIAGLITGSGCPGQDATAALGALLSRAVPRQYLVFVARNHFRLDGENSITSPR